MPVISVRNVSKSFRMQKQRGFLAQHLVQRLLFRSSYAAEHQALCDVSFDVEKGESLGVIGANGSGKSTLLSLIARTSYPTSGTIEVHGRVGPMLELGAGFHPNLTGLENVRLNAALLGLTDEETSARLDSILEYAGVGEFIEAPLHTYSTGMMARLGFAVLAHIEPEVLLVDEALSVGDSEFQQKCQRTMQAMLAAGTTMFLVSHDLSLVQELCRRAIWIHAGRVIEDGPSEAVVQRYREGIGPMLAGEG